MVTGAGAGAVGKGVFHLCVGCWYICIYNALRCALLVYFSQNNFCVWPHARGNRALLPTLMLLDQRVAKGGVRVVK